MRHFKKGNIGFWRYNSPGRPFLAAKIVEINKTSRWPGFGYFIAEGFGRVWFKPQFCLPAKAGLKLYEQLNKLGEQREMAVSNADAGFAKAVRSIMPKGVKL